MERVVFLDRDGTINVEVNYLYQREDLKLIDGAGQAIKALNDNNYKVVVVTNQAGIARGYYSEQEVEDLHTYLNEVLNLYNAHIDAFFYCPHHPEYGIGNYKKDCQCRKPNIGMFQAAQQSYTIDKSQSWMIGDNAGDIKAGMNFGVKTILVGTGYGNQVHSLKDSGLVYETYTKDIKTAVDYILTHQISPSFLSKT